MALTVKSQSHKTALLLGVGYSARALVPHLRRAGYDIYGTRRTPDGAGIPDVKDIIFDGEISERLRGVMSKASLLLSSIPPREAGDPFLNAIAGDVCAAMPHLEWAGYLSATSVYGDRDGDWVFEPELLYPATARGRRRVEAELAWLETGAPMHIFRLAGIYGPQISGISRNPFSRLREGSARAVIKPGHVVNRIHVEDIAAAIMCSLARPCPMTVYNLADDEPAPPQDVIHYAADLLGMARPAQISYIDEQLSEMARSFYGETKRVSNTRAKQDLGWQPQYANYRLGLMAAYKAEQESTNLVLLSGHIDVDDADISQIKTALEDHIKLTRAEPGCERFDIWQDKAVPNIFHVFETFTSPAAFKSHQDRIKASDWTALSQNAKRHYDVIGLEA